MSRRSTPIFIACGVACMVLLVFAFIGGVFYGKVTLPGAWPDVLSAVNVVGIQLLNAAWNLIAKWLADRENYRTETEYEDALIVYLFGFQFVKLAKMSISSELSSPTTIFFLSTLAFISFAVRYFYSSSAPLCLLNSARFVPPEVSVTGLQSVDIIAPSGSVMLELLLSGVT